MKIIIRSTGINQIPDEIHKFIDINIFSIINWIQNKSNYKFEMKNKIYIITTNQLTINILLLLAYSLHI